MQDILCYLIESSVVNSTKRENMYDI